MQKTSAESITATIQRPSNQFANDWNWADAGRDAWLTAAGHAGLTIQAETWDGVSDEYGCTRVQVDGQWYEIELRGDEARAVALGR